MLDFFRLHVNPIILSLSIFSGESSDFGNSILFPKKSGHYIRDRISEHYVWEMLKVFLLFYVLFLRMASVAAKVGLEEFLLWAD